MAKAQLRAPAIILGGALLVALAARWGAEGGGAGASKAPEREPEPALVPLQRGVEGELLREFHGAYSSRAPEARATRRYELRAAPAKVQLFEGREMEVWAYNAAVPGPVLRVRHGERLRVELDNALPQPTTIHWHGVRVPNAMDGVPGVSQDPVEPGGKFVYEFVPKDVGTFWFHPHVRSAEQVERGLYGVLIVEDATPLPYSQDVVWVLDDWRLTRDGSAIDPNFVTRHDLAHDGRWGQTIAVNGSTQERLSVEPGERIRLRLVNPANGRVFAPDFSAFDAQVIAVDGMYTARPVSPAGFELAPGNRLELDITIRPDQAGESFTIIDRFYAQRPNELATIDVGTSPVPTPEFSSPARAKVPAWSAAHGAPAHKEFSLNARRGGEHGLEWTINDRAYPDYKLEPLGRGQWHKLRFVNRSARLHPMHIHGQFFKLISRNGRPVDEPFWRDTVLLHRKETVEVGMVPLDEGRWMLHCHILEHAAAGMMTLVRVEEMEHAIEPLVPGDRVEG